MPIFSSTPMRRPPITAPRIDGPSHYADYDEDGSQYSVSEERYTFNLRVERSLRTHGFEVYRFSNFEVENTPLEEFRELIKHLPGQW